MMRILPGIIIMLTAFSGACQSRTLPSKPPEVYTYNSSANGIPVTIEFTRGKEFNHPLMAIWVEDQSGRFLQTIYVAESIGRGVFAHGNTSSGRWMPGELRRPAALPVWSHRRGIRAEDGLFIPDKKNPVPDAYTGPTPNGNFTLNSVIENPPPVFIIWFEINQSWDWNEYWTNNKFPDDEEYKTSCQPALVYKAEINPLSGQKEYVMKVVGHSHYSGKNGKITEDLSTITTALNITERVKISLKL